MTFFGPSMMEKTMVEARGGNFGELPVTVGGRGRAMRVSLVHVRASVQGVGSN